eukprot:gb/GECG01003262.1/.p1 GENE.gb/GECG01003262.1/~~gb/GECG01003262.1/.p1  ORF type:complete len:121 (+),score=19.32 gb/GECG01003262.1/:1-363(+)
MLSTPIKNPPNNFYPLDESISKEDWVDVDYVGEKPLRKSLKSEVQDYLESVFDRYTHQMTVFRRIVQVRDDLKTDMIKREDEIVDTVVHGDSATNTFRAASKIRQEARAMKIKEIEVCPL